MIVSRAPLRFSLGGGGSDLPAYAGRHGGYVIAAAIDKYIYVTCNQRFYPDIRLAYSKTEIVARVDDIEHPIFREALRIQGIEGSIELTSVAELPAHSGLGSSSSFSVALLNALHAYKREFVSSRQLAEEACHIEIDRLGEPIGRQDQFIAAFGGVSAMTFGADGSVRIEPVPVAPEVLDELEQNLVIVYSGIERHARSVLGEEGDKLAVAGGPAESEMHRIKALGHEVYRLLTRGDVDGYGDLLHEHWTRKRSLASTMTDPSLDELYEDGRRAGALGGKLMGAGGGGFFMFYVPSNTRRGFLAAMAARGARRLRFGFDRDGARIVANLHRS
jgi:D-glycero-alpha-D-manno-heptose-7-phosphate kinase